MNTRMNWQNLLSTQRFRPKNGEIVPTVTPSTQEGADALRTDFHIDYDRVVFSGAFRRLGRKTQVHPLAQHDLTHNRLTRGRDVAQRRFSAAGQYAQRYWCRGAGCLFGA